MIKRFVLLAAMLGLGAIIMPSYKPFKLEPVYICLEHDPEFKKCFKFKLDE